MAPKRASKQPEKKQAHPLAIDVLSPAAQVFDVPSSRHATTTSLGMTVMEAESSVEDGLLSPRSERGIAQVIIPQC